MGVIVIGAMALYLLISIGVVAWAISHAKKRGKSATRWGLGAVLVMYLIPFWDWIPTVAVHQYYCSKDSGFWIYKTLDQWTEENPGVAERLVANEPSVVVQGAYVLNQRFNWTIKRESFFLLNYLTRNEQQVVDSKVGDVLARYVDYSTSHKPREAGWAGWKFWLAAPHCSGGQRNASQFAQWCSGSDLCNELICNRYASNRALF